MSFDIRGKRIIRSISGLLLIGAALVSYSNNKSVEAINNTAIIYDTNNTIMENATETTTNSTIGADDFDFADWRLILINKQHPVPDDYKYSLEIIEGVPKADGRTMECDSRIIDDMNKMIEDAALEDVILVIASPYREVSRQAYLFDQKIDDSIRRGNSYIDSFRSVSRIVTVPNASEHQVGLAIDFMSDKYKSLDEGFADTQAGIWLKYNSYKYGFILRYPKDKEDVTGIIFEPWHYRYVGKKASILMYEENITLEEFWDRYK